eukprot:gene46317-56716_t
MVFTSHRVDECLRLCTRVVLLSQGRVALADSPQAFQQLAALFFQVDVTLHTVANEHAASFAAEVMRSVRVERFVAYAGGKLRFVFDRSACPLHQAHRLFEARRAAGALRRYALRGLDMEEVLGGLMGAQQKAGFNDEDAASTREHR